MIFISQATATTDLAPSYFYLVYDVFDGTHRTTGMKLNVERKVGTWSPKTTVPVAVHNQDLLDAIAIRFAGLCNELQVVAKSSSYTDSLMLLYKELLNLAKSNATEIQFQRPLPWSSSQHPVKLQHRQRRKELRKPLHLPL